MRGFFVFFGAACVIGACANGQVDLPDDDSGTMMMPDSAPCTSMCGGMCVDTKTDATNCGKCGVACPSGSTCVQGTCQCSTMGQTKCTAGCVDLKTDAQNCGKCGTICGNDAGVIPGGGTYGCNMGTCGILCPMGKSECSGACIDLKTDSANCGMCDNACTMTQTCLSGMCCNMGETICNNACTATQSDPMNCGMCGNQCPMNKPACVMGTCSTALVYSKMFTGLQVPPAQHCTDWITFRNQASSNAASITIKGSNDSVGVTCTGGTAAQIVNALKAGSSFNGTCNNRTWSVGTCVGGQDIGVSGDGAICTCAGKYAVRPCINHQDWGGVTNGSCAQPSQTLTVEIQ